jgi:hypothetical protein
MNGLESIAKTLRDLAKNAVSTAGTSIDANKDEYVALQKDQLLHGVNAAGGTFRKYRNAAYARRKNKLNPLAGLNNPDLKLTGRFYDGIFVKVNNGILTVGSTDSKSQLLESEYKNVFGLNPQEMEDFIYGRIQPALIKNISSQLKFD